MNRCSAVALKYGSLFSGIGGIDLGLDRAGMTCMWQVENDPFCVEILKKYWPEVQKYGDIKVLDPADLSPVDLICGGFPCQPVSVAGRRKAQKDTRWLWSQFARIIGVLRPRYVLVENVPGLRSANQGEAFQEVLADLARHGYDAEWASIPAAAVGAPHLRYRVFIVAYASTVRQQSNRELGAGEYVGQKQTRPYPLDGRADVADADTARLQRRYIYTECPSQQFTGKGGIALGANWLVEPDVGRVAHGVPARVDRLKALGNAVVPQVAQYIGERIIAFNANRLRRKNNVC